MDDTQLNDTARDFRSNSMKIPITFRPLTES